MAAVPKGGGAGRWRWALIGSVALLGGAVMRVGMESEAVTAHGSTSSGPAGVPLPPDEEIVASFPLRCRPTARILVYVARRRGVPQLHLRSLDSLESTVLVGTEGARAPFFSPDSQWVGFFADGKLKKIPVTGGAAQIVV